MKLVFFVTRKILLDEAILQNLLFFYWLCNSLSRFFFFFLFLQLILLKRKLFPRRRVTGNPERVWKRKTVFSVMKFTLLSFSEWIQTCFHCGNGRQKSCIQGWFRTNWGSCQTETVIAGFWQLKEKKTRQKVHLNLFFFLTGTVRKYFLHPLFSCTAFIIRLTNELLKLLQEIFFLNSKLHKLQLYF